jgi:hydroxyethylthiazole kinase-like uncharacterized protein yjeF
MRQLAFPAAMQQLDRVAIEEWGISSLALMERAAEQVAQAVDRLLRLPEHRGGPPFSQKRPLAGGLDDHPLQVGILCGPGNNGGDGIAAARLLLARGYRVRVFLVGRREKMTPDAQEMEARLAQAGGRLESFSSRNQEQLSWLAQCQGKVDALFGVGLSRTVEGEFLEAVKLLQSTPGCPVVACDIPSGLHGATGEILGEAVHAAVTVTFTCAKPGLYLGEGRACSGQVVVADIGIPTALVERMLSSQQGQLQGMEPGRYGLPLRPRTAHKGDFGKVFLLAGSQGYTGAPVLAASAAVRIGAGLVFLGVPAQIYPIVAVKCNEAMPFPLPDTYEAILDRARQCDVALIGPGLGRSPETGRLVRRLLEDLEIPVVLDADGINACAGHIDVLDKRRAWTILTPHDGEFQRLTGCKLPIGDRLGAAREFAQAHPCILVLKGHATVTAAPDGRAWINATGNPGMAKGGSGDVLAGMVAGLLGQRHLQGLGTAELVARAVCYHGMAGDRCAQVWGEYGMTPSDLLQVLPQVLKDQEEGTGNHSIDE